MIQRLLLLLSLFLPTFVQAQDLFVKSQLAGCKQLYSNVDLTTTTTSSVVDWGVSRPRSMTAVFVATNDSGTTPTLDAKIQSCAKQSDGSYVCGDVFTADQCTTGSCYGGDTVQFIDANEGAMNLFQYFRFVGTVGGTTPNYNVSAYLCGTPS